MINPQDSLIHALQDSVKSLNLELTKHTYLYDFWNSIWYKFKLTDANVLIIVAIAISSIITIIVTWILHKSSYKNEYYKRIIKKRIQTYQFVEIVNQQLRNQVVYPNGDNCCQIFQTNGTYCAFFEELLKVGANAYWINKKLDDQLNKLNIFLASEFKRSYSDETIRQLGVKHQIIINDIHIKIEKLMLADFKTLHKVRKFLNEKSPGMLQKTLIKLTKKGQQT